MRLLKDSDPFPRHPYCEFFTRNDFDVQMRALSPKALSLPGMMLWIEELTVHTLQHYEDDLLWSHFPDDQIQLPEDQECADILENGVPVQVVIRRSVLVDAPRNNQHRKNAYCRNYHAQKLEQYRADERKAFDAKDNAILALECLKNERDMVSIDRFKESMNIYFARAEEAVDGYAWFCGFEAQMMTEMEEEGLDVKSIPWLHMQAH
ncbi:hypothetical protein EF72_21385 [Salmonella enterica]|nr:hypothetical protein [Salmonella enterica]